MDVNVDSILYHITRMTSNYARNYILIKYNDGRIVQDYTDVWMDGICSIRCEYGNTYLFRYNINGKIVIDLRVYCRDQGIEIKALDTNSLYESLISDNREHEWQKITDSLVILFDTNKEDIIHRRSVPVRPHYQLSRMNSQLDTLKNLTAKYTKTDILAVLDVAFEKYSAFTQKPYEPSRYQIESTAGNLKMFILYNEVNGKHLGFDVAMFYCEGNMRIELVDLYYSTIKNQYISALDAYLPDGFDEGFAKFRLLGTLMN